MQIAAITEIITHFAGLLHLDADPERLWSRPDGAGPPAHDSADPIDGLRDAPHHPDLAAVASAPSPFVQHHTFDDGMIRLPRISAHPFVVHPHLPPLHLAPAPDLPTFTPPAGSSDDTPSDVSASWQGADQTVVDVHQVNMLIADTSYVDHATGSALPIPDGTPIVHDMIVQAYAAIPGDAPGLGASDSQELQTFKSYGDALASGSTPVSDTLHQGTTVDGTLASTNGDPVPLTLPVSSLDMTTPTGADVPLGQTIVTGMDVAGNEALIADTSAANLTSIVMGNSTHADLIVQSNVVQNIDAIAAAAQPEASAQSFAQALLTGGDTVSNTAHFEQLPLTFSADVTGGLGTQWNISVVNGDFYDINAVTQQNVLVNDTLYVGAPQTDHYDIILGGNTQINQFSLVHDAPTYDLLIVLGNSYTANAIYQENVLLNDTNVGVTFSGTNDASNQVVAGHDSVTNDAAISDIGTSGTATLTPDLQALVQSLTSSGSATYPGLPSLNASINVMIVTGNYYDLNLISQTNVVSNNANVLADLSKAGSGTPTSVTTGQDTLSNSAAIVSAGTLGTQYVGGQAYETAMLVQTSLITTHADTAGGTPNALVPELVAFLDTGSTHDSHTAPAPPTTTDAAHHDVLAGTLA